MSKLKVSVIGSRTGGKTHFCKKLTSCPRLSRGKYIATLGVEVYLFNGVHIWDLADFNGPYAGLGDKYLQGTTHLIIVKDQTKRDRYPKKYYQEKYPNFKIIEISSELINESTREELIAIYNNFTNL